MLCWPIISCSTLSFQEKTVSCNVTGVGENDRETFTKPMSDRSNGFDKTFTAAIDMSEKSYTREINERLQKSIYSSITANDFDKNLWK